MNSCAKLAKSISLGACRVSNNAISSEVILIDFDDWAGATITETSSVISAITLPSGAYGYKFTSKEKAFEGSYSLNKGSYGSSYVHQLILRAFERTQDVKDFLNKLANGRVVAIVKNIDVTNAQTVYEVYGRQNGMLASAIEATSNDGDGVLSTITLASDDAAKESEVPTSVYVTSLAATKTMVDALVASAN